MVESPRFGLAAIAMPRQKQKVAQALAGKTDDLSTQFADLLEDTMGLSEDGRILTAVINSSKRAFDFSVALQEAAWPINVRFALVSAPPAGAAGRIGVIRDKATATLLQADSNCAFHFDLPSRSQPELGMASALVKLHGSLTAEWTESRANAVRSYRQHGKQSEVAEELGVSQQAVSQMLRGARLRELEDAETAMRDWLAGPKRATLWPPR